MNQDDYNDTMSGAAICAGVALAGVAAFVGICYLLFTWAFS